MSFYRAVPPAILSLLLSLLLAGCGAGDIHAVVHADGSAELALELRLPAGVPQGAELVEPLDEAFARAGFVTSRTMAGGKPVWRAERRFPRGFWQEGGRLSGWRPYAELAEVRYSADESWFYTDYRLKATIDPERLIPESAVQAIGSLTDSLAPAARRLVLNRVHVNLLLTLPLAPRSSNADAVSDGGRTLLWRLPLSQPTEVRLEARAPNVRHLLYAGAGGLTACLLLLLLWMRLRHRRLRRDAS